MSAVERPHPLPSALPSRGSRPHGRGPTPRWGPAPGPRGVPRGSPFLFFSRTLDASGEGGPETSSLSLSNLWQKMWRQKNHTTNTKKPLEKISATGRPGGGTTFLNCDRGREFRILYPLPLRTHTHTSPSPTLDKKGTKATRDTENNRNRQKSKY